MFQHSKEPEGHETEPILGVSRRRVQVSKSCHAFEGWGASLFSVEENVPQ